jgi:hypothetical protein
METYEEPTFPGFEDASRFYLQAYPASRPPLPGSAEARMMTVGSGRQCSMLFETSSPLGLFSKILMEFSAWGNSLECLHVWERLDTRFELSGFQLARWEQDTNDTECSLLPTMAVPNGGRVNPEGTSITGKKPDGGKAQMDLRHAMAKLSATPSARDWKNGKASSNTVERNSRPLNEQVISSIVSEVSGMLNPRFVEEYQGFPIDHTALEPSATPSSPSKPIRSLRRSPRLKHE